MQAPSTTMRVSRTVGSSDRRKSVSLREVAQAWYLRPQELPPDVDLGGLEATVGFRPKRDTGAFSYASHAAVVAVDTELGRGRDPRLRHRRRLRHAGQSNGGRRPDAWAAWRRASAPRCTRRVRYDSNGQPLASTFADYLLPGPTEIPSHPHLSYGDAVALHRVRHQGHGRRRRDCAAGGDLQCGQRCAATARRGTHGDAADAAPAARGDRPRQAVERAASGSA